MNIINGYGDIDLVFIFSGSFVEGLDIKGSDEDIVFIFKYIIVVFFNVVFVFKNDEIVVLVDFDQDFLGFVMICLLFDVLVNSYVQKVIVLLFLLFREQFREIG